MRIVEIHLRQLCADVAEPLPPRGDVGYGIFHHHGTEKQSLVVIEMQADVGLRGVTALAWAGPQAMQRIVDRFAPLLLEVDASDIRSAIRGLRGICSEPSDRDIVNHLEFALWDLLGKERGMPLCRLWGATAPARGIEVYASSLYYRPLVQVLEEANRVARQGFSTIKIKIGHGPEEDVALVRAVRESLGPGVGLLLDANRAYDLPGALRLVDGLADAGIIWLEEPFPYLAGAAAPCPWACHEVDAWGIEQYRRLRDATDIPLAGAEGFCDYGQISCLLAGGCVDVVQPDTGHLGPAGMLGAFELAEQQRVTVTPHACCDAAALVVSLHLQAVAGNAAAQEYEVFDSPLVQDLFAGQRQWLRQDSTVAVPSAPGLGVELNPETCHRYCAGVRSLRR